MTIDECLADIEQSNVYKFKEYHKEHPHIWQLYKKYALKIAMQGKKFGSNMIMEKIRWESYFLKKEGDIYKVNNNYSPHYARLFLREYPEYTDLLVTRRLNSI